MGIDFTTEIRVTGAAAAGAGIQDISSGNANLPTIDRLGFEGVAFILSGDPVFVGDANFYLQHSDDNVTFVDMPVELMKNRSAVATAAGVAGRIGSLIQLSARVVPVGTISKKRYLRIRIGEASGSGGMIGVTALRFNARRCPVTLGSW